MRVLDAAAVAMEQEEEAKLVKEGMQEQPQEQETRPERKHEEQEQQQSRSWFLPPPLPGRTVTKRSPLPHPTSSSCAPACRVVAPAPSRAVAAAPGTRSLRQCR